MTLEHQNTKLKNVLLVFTITACLLLLLEIILDVVFKLIGINTNSTTETLCSDYLTIKYSDNSYRILVSSFINLLFAFVYSIILSLMLVWKRTINKSITPLINWNSFSYKSLTIVYVIYSLTLLNTGASMGYFLQLIVEKGFCLNQVAAEWIVLFVLSTVVSLLLLICWIINLILIYSERQSQLQNIKNIDEISFGADNHAIFNNFRTDVENSSSVAPTIKIKEQGNIKQKPNIQKLKSQLQTIKKSIAQTNNKSIERKRNSQNKQSNIGQETEREQLKEKEDNVKKLMKFQSFNKKLNQNDHNSPTDINKQQYNKTSPSNQTSKSLKNKQSDNFFKSNTNKSESTKNKKNIIGKDSLKTNQLNETNRLNTNRLQVSFVSNQFKPNQLKQQQSQSQKIFLKKIYSEDHHKKQDDFQNSVNNDNPYNKFIKEDQIKQQQLQLLIYSKMINKMHREQSMTYQKKRNFGSGKQRLFKDPLLQENPNRVCRKKQSNTNNDKGNNRQIQQGVISFLKQKYIN